MGACGAWFEILNLRASIRASIGETDRATIRATIRASIGEFDRAERSEWNERREAERVK
jgi:hypothetical protein